MGETCADGGSISTPMKADIHPDYVEAHVTCSCGNSFVTRSTKATLTSELCSECHPFYTGKQKLVDSGGRIEKFEKRYGRRTKTADQADQD
jgi:large subunit ribosomal protein L31